MENSELHRKLIAVAKQNPPMDSVPYAFEKRIMAGLQNCKVLDPLKLWNHYFAVAAVCSMVLVFGLSIGVRYLPEENSGQTTFSQEVEQTLYSAVETPNNDQEIW